MFFLKIMKSDFYEKDSISEYRQVLKIHYFRRERAVIPLSQTSRTQIAANAAIANNLTVCNM